DLAHRPRIRRLDFRHLLLDPLDHRVGAGHTRGPLEQAHASAVDDRVEHAEDHLDLGREVLERCARRDVGGRGDLPDGRRLVALVEEEVDRGVEGGDTGATRLALAQAKPRHFGRRHRRKAYSGNARDLLRSRGGKPTRGSVRPVPTGWDPLPYEAWTATCDTLHSHAQVLGKLAGVLAPPEPQFQHVALRLT